MSTNFLYLHTAPSASAPLLVNSYLSTTPDDRMYNWGNKVGTGRVYYRAERSGDWDAIYFSGQVGWFYNPGGRATRIPVVGGNQVVITPKAGSGSIPVYGGGYPGDAAYMPPISPQHMDKIYDLPEGQRYIAEGPLTADYYYAPVWVPTLAGSHNTDVRDSTPYYAVSFNHRLGLVRAADVAVVPVTRGHGGGPDRHGAAARAADAGPAAGSDGTPEGDAAPDMSLRDLRGQ
jgi:hypothetical protein